MSMAERTGVPDEPESGDWLTIHQASALVGVSVATLRRWCDAGELRCFTTPGGHRRFDRSAVLGLMPASSVRRPRVGAGGETAIRIVRAYRHAVRHRSHPAALEPISDRARQPFRDHGRAMVAALVDALDESREDGSSARARARAGARACGHAAALEGMTLQQAIEVFLHFRAPFLHEIGALARRWGLDAAAATALLERASDAIDGLLPAMVSGFEDAPD